MRTCARTVVLLACGFTAVGCAHARVQRPGTGSLAFRAHWHGPSDVDLAVNSPLGEHIDFGSKSVASGGRLDIDCNYSSARIEPPAAGAGRERDTMPAIERHPCDHPMENIFWPHGDPPPGLYRVLLYLANPDPPPGAADLYELDVIVRGEVKLHRSGRVTELATTPIDLVLEIR